MTTLALRWSRSKLELAATAGLVVWAVLATALRLGLLPGYEYRRETLVMIVALPAVLVALTAFRRARTTALPALAGLSCCVAAALLLPEQLATNPKIAYAVPGAALAGVVTQRYPVASLTAMFSLSAFYGSAEAFLGLPGIRIAVWVVAALWVGVLGGFLFSRRERTVRLTPAFFLLLAFLIFSSATALTTDPFSSGFLALRIAPLYLSVALLVGYGGFRARHLLTFSRAMLVICFAVAAYATLRWAIGPAEAERGLLKSGEDVRYNTLSLAGEAKVQGSFPNGNALGLWLACTTPFVLTAALAWRGRLRLIAFATLPLAAVALLASGQRTAVVAIIAGALTVVVLYSLSRGHRGSRAGIALAAIAVSLISAIVVYPIVIDAPENRDRYAKILTPTEDLPFSVRLVKWRQVLDLMDEKPMGHGLGAADPLSVGGFRFLDISRTAIDNAYLVVGYEQGWFAMFLFIAALLVVLLELLRFAVWTRGPDVGAMGVAAVGTLVAMLIEFVAANYTVFPPIMAGWAIVGLGLAAFSLPQQADVAT